jgi:hypothetical protein
MAWSPAQKAATGFSAKAVGAVSASFLFYGIERNWSTSGLIVFSRGKDLSGFAKVIDYSGGVAVADASD